MTIKPMTNSQHMTYGMPVLTEEQRKALIDCLKPQITNLEEVRDNIPFGLDEDGGKHLKTLKIILATLEARKEYHTLIGEYYTAPPVSSFREISNPTTETFREIPNSSTAPPVPVMKIPDGWRLVPIEPTPAMQTAGGVAVKCETTAINKLWTGNAVYKAMLAAAPEAPHG